MVVFYGKMKSTGALKGKIPQLSFFRIPAALFFNETKKRCKLIFYHTGSSPWDWYHRNVVSGGEGAEFLWDRSWAAYATLHVTRPLNWGVSVAILLSELFSEVLAWEATARSTLLASETRLAQRKRLDFILLPRFYFYFPRIVNGDKSLFHLLSHSSFWRGSEEWGSSSETLSYWVWASSCPRVEKQDFSQPVLNVGDVTRPQGWRFMPLSDHHLSKVLVTKDARQFKIHGQNISKRKVVMCPCFPKNEVI